MPVLLYAPLRDCGSVFSLGCSRYTSWTGVNSGFEGIRAAAVPRISTSDKTSCVYLSFASRPVLKRAPPLPAHATPPVAVFRRDA